jgi:site-specific DNA-methyltransferase (adenine-specific)
MNGPYRAPTGYPEDWGIEPPDRVRVAEGDCRERIKEISDCSIDPVVTDPPYHLTSIVKRFGKDGSAPAQAGVDGRFKRLSGGFMNKKWDAPDAPPIDPSFAHWFAGFVDGEGCFHVHKKQVNGCETYDCQFSITLRADDAPIVKDIQIQLGGIGTIAKRPGKGNSNDQVRYCVSSQKHCWRLREILAQFPLRAKKARDFEIWSAALDAWINHEPGEPWDDVAYFREALMAVRQYGAAYHPSQLFHYQWAREAYRVLKPGGHLLAFCGPRTYHRMAAAIEDAGFEIRDCLLWMFGSGFPKSHNLDGKVPGFDGWGTALKPAAEFICMARKPLVGTVAANVLEHGTGALNIDGCRVTVDPVADASQLRTMQRGQRTEDTSGQTWGLSKNSGDKPQVVRANGRWPANVIHDGSDEVLAAFPDAPGQQRTVGPEHGAKSSVNVYGDYGARETFAPRSDAGSAARFFYSAKADAEDRLGSKHPTVKPVDLMAYLCRLVTPPGGLVLDPFAGSGTTGMACLREGFRAILIEREPEYVADIKRRLAHVAGTDTPLFGSAAE